VSQLSCFPWLKGTIEACASSLVVLSCYLPHKAKWRICPLGRQSCLLWKNLLRNWLWHLPGILRSHEAGLSVAVKRIQWL
jgi:hypothetical protein